MDFSNVCGYTNRDHCFNTEYIPNNETKRDNGHTPSSGHVAAGLDHTDSRTSFNPGTNETGKAVLATSVLINPRWAAYDRQGGYCRLKQAVYLEIEPVPTEDFIHHLQYLDHRKGRSHKIWTGQICHY